MRRLGQPVRLFYPNNPVDPRILLNRESNCDKIDTGAGLSTMVGGGASKPVAAAAAPTAIGTHPKSKSLTAMPSGSTRLIAKRQLEVALASALAGGGTCSSEDNNQ